MTTRNVNAAVDYEFLTVDVFTDEPFGGNQLAVIPSAHRLTTDAMQLIAAEFNYAETTFVLPSADPDDSCLVRIFTPRAELPFAGHPIIGTAAVISHLGKNTADQLRLEVGAGTIDVTVETDHEGRLTATMHISAALTTHRSADLMDLSRVLTLEPKHLIRTFYAGLGLTFCHVQANAPELVDSAVVNRTAWEQFAKDSPAPHLYLYATDHPAQPDTYARMFAPALGVPEDPATGSAAAALVAQLATEAREDTQLSIRQGVQIRRASTINASATWVRDRLGTISVGGYIAPVARGRLSVPAHLLDPPTPGPDKPGKRGSVRRPTP